MSTVLYNGKPVLSFDLEIFNELEQDADGKNHLETCIVSTAAWSTDTAPSKVQFYYDAPYLTRSHSQALVGDIIAEMKKGAIPFTWNGTSFDFHVLAVHSDMWEECAKIALFSIDGMLEVTFANGYFLGLDKALVGAGLETKLHTVTLNDGTVLEDMSGMLAPKLWRDGEFDAVNAYLTMDVIQPLKLVESMTRTQKIFWMSKNGNPMSLRLKKGELHLAKNLFSIPEPDVSRFTNAPHRKQFFEWMPKNILERYCPEAL